MVLYCMYCNEKYEDRHRGAHSEAEMFRVVDAVGTEPTSKLFFCDRSCYKASVKSAEKQSQKRAAAAAAAPRKVYHEPDPADSTDDEQ